jgi:hypothetical protein
VDVRRAAVQLAKALAAALYVARRCRDSPRWKIRTWEAEMMILDAASALAWTWPAAHRALEERTQEAWRRGAGVAPKLDGAGGRDLCGERLPGLEVLYVRGAGEKAGDKPGASRRAGPLHRASESLRKAQALLEAAALPRGRLHDAESTPATKPPPRSVNSFNPS